MASLKFELSRDKTSYAVVGVGLFGKNVEEVEIPEEYKGKPVTAIGERAFYQLMKLRRVSIPDSVSSIGDYAFWRCFRLDEFTIPSSITSIGKYAFQYCDGLSSVTIPESVALIGENAFAGCGILTVHCDATEKPEGWSESWRGDTPVAWRDIPQNQRLEFKLNDSDGTYSVVGIGKFDGTELEIPETYRDKPVTAIENAAFDNCEKITGVIVPESVTRIGESAFRGCKNLKSINVDAYNTEYSSIDGNLYNESGTTLIQYAAGKSDTSFEIPRSVTSVGNYAFFGVSALTDVTLHDGITNIGRWSFANCVGLSSVDIPDSVTDVGGSAFFGCERLARLTIGKGVRRIWSGAFGSCLSLPEVTIHKDITKIDESAFSRCTSLKRITVDEDNAEYKSVDGNLYTKDGKVLVHCAADNVGTSFTVPKGVTVIGAFAFSYCKSLTSVTIPDGVESIGRYAFISCTGLTDVVIPDSVTVIDKFAFFSCTGLSSAVIPESVTRIDSGAFKGCREATVRCAAAEKPAGWDAAWNGDCPVVWGYKGE